MQKQEEEKKIQAKFSALKQSRAKRGGKYGEESDSDAMAANSSDMYHKYNHKGGRLSSTDDEDGVNKAARQLNKDHTGKFSTNQSNFSHFCNFIFCF